MGYFLKRINLSGKLEFASNKIVKRKNIQLHAVLV